MAEISYHIATQKRPVPVVEHRLRALPSRTNMGSVMTNSIVSNSPEAWKPVVGWEKLYEVSSTGRVRSLDRTVATRNRWGRMVRTYRGQMLTPHPAGGGYPHVMLYRDGKAKNAFVHTLVARAFLGPRPKGFQVNHRDLDKSNNVVSNLEYVSAIDNMAHAYNNDAIPVPRGEKHCHAKLNRKDVEEILLRLSSGESQYSIAADYEVRRSAISKISCGNAWKHVPRPKSMRQPDAV